MKNQEYRNRERNAGNAGNWGNVISRGMSPNIPGNVLKHSRECPQTFWRMSPKISGNFLKHSGECLQTFRGMSPNNPGNDLKHSLLLKNDPVKR